VARPQPPGPRHPRRHPTIGRQVRDEVVTAHPDKPVADVRARVAASPHRFALVTSVDGILLGRLRGTTLTDSAATRQVGEVMEGGPSTLRAHEPAAAIRAQLTDKGLSYAIVTDPDGRLMGTIDPCDLCPFDL
jgi:CBS domain-containing protein